MKKYWLLALLCISIFSFSQEKQTRLKGNPLFLPVGMINLGIERELTDNISLQGDVFISPWKSFKGKHLQVYMGHIEGRYHFKEVFSKWYVGLNMGGSVFDLQKWNYWNADKYQRGFSIMLGGVVGYQYQWNENWNIDFYLGGGFSQGFYHGYSSTEPIGRYESADHWNKSGEWIPYRGGIMISYKL